LTLVLRSVIPGVVGLVMGGLAACTAPNPAYHIGDLTGGESGSTMPSSTPDAARPTDGRAADATGPQAACGLERPDIKDLVGVDSLAIDKAGNIYFTNDDGTTARIGKLPPKGAGANRQWLTIPRGLPNRGMAVDSARAVLYFTAGASPADLQAVDLAAATPRARIVYSGLVDPNDLAVGPDGNVYVSDQGDGQIYSFSPTGQRTKVTRTPLGVPAEYSGPAGLAFAADGTLVVGIKGDLPLFRLTLVGGMEMNRQAFGMVNEWANGLVYDERGRLYVALFNQTMPRDVVRLDSDTAAPVAVMKTGRFSSMAFGRGELNCHDLYVTEASPGAVVRRMTTDTRGQAIP
jgi:sugar lactone lactonase YvrE